MSSRCSIIYEQVSTLVLIPAAKDEWSETPLNKGRKLNDKVTGAKTMACIVMQDYCLNTTYLTFTMGTQLWVIYCLELSTLLLVFQILQKSLFSDTNVSKNKSIFPFDKEMFNEALPNLLGLYKSSECGIQTRNICQSFHPFA